MNRLADEPVRLCKKGAPGIDDGDASVLLAGLRGWHIIQDGDIVKLQREYRFSDYLMLLDLTGKIGSMAQQVNHHPDLHLEWGCLTVTWWTHVIGGLHRNDFIMAARCDRVAMLVSAP